MGFALTFTAPVPPPTPVTELVTATPGVVDFLVNLVPRNPIQVAADGSLLPLLIFIVLLAAASTTLPAEKRESLTSLAETLGDALIKLMTWILWTAPVGVFGLAAPVIARTGMAMLQNLAVFIVAVIVGLFILKGLVLLPMVRIFGGMGLRRFIRGTVGTYTVGFTTTTSVGTLPMMLQEAEKLGLSKSSFTLILPLAASINRPGSALFQSTSLVFLAAMYGVPLDAGLIAAAVLAIFLASMTVAPVPSASIVSMAPALDVVGVPIAGLGILLGIDRVPDVFRSATNVIGHMAAATTVDGMTKGGARGHRGERTLGGARSDGSGWNQARCKVNPPARATALALRGFLQERMNVLHHPQTAGVPAVESANAASPPPRAPPRGQQYPGRDAGSGLVGAADPRRSLATHGA